jgi:hypothetical protein
MSEGGAKWKFEVGDLIYHTHDHHKTDVYLVQKRYIAEAHQALNIASCPMYLLLALQDGEQYRYSQVTVERYSLPYREGEASAQPTSPTTPKSGEPQ